MNTFITVTSTEETSMNVPMSINTSQITHIEQISQGSSEIFLANNGSICVHATLDQIQVMIEEANKKVLALRYAACS